MREEQWGINVVNKLISIFSRVHKEYTDHTETFLSGKILCLLGLCILNSSLHFDSYHPIHLEHNLPFGPFVSLKRNCTLHFSYDSMADSFSEGVLQQQFPRMVID